MDREEAREFVQKQKAERTNALSSQRQMLSDEIRVCTRCGWQARKSQCIAMGISKCPKCGNTQCTAMSMDFDPELMRRMQARPRGG
jgi:hypothetical protein